MLIKLITVFVFSLVMLGSNHAFAATDGDLDTTSTGSLGISLGVSNLVRITGIDDLDFGTYSGGSSLSRDDDVCIWTNQSGGNYKVTAQGSGAANAFTLASGGNTLAYSARWNNTTGTSGNTALTADVLSGAFSGASTTSSTCSGGSNANFQVLIASSDLLAVRPGTYTGVLTFVISPSA